MESLKSDFRVLTTSQGGQLTPYKLGVFERWRNFYGHDHATIMERMMGAVNMKIAWFWGKMAFFTDYKMEEKYPSIFTKY